MSSCAGVIKSAIADGPGVRVSVFLSGCPHQCPGCFNSEAWDYDYGTPLTPEAIEKVQSLLDHSFIRGLTLLGGEPLAPQNVEASIRLATAAKRLGKDVWIYTGYTFEDVMALAFSSEQYRKILILCDVLVDGRFQQEQANKQLVFKGSANQRIIDIHASLEQKKLVLWEEPYAHH